MLVADLTKRYGNLKGGKFFFVGKYIYIEIFQIKGVNDIKTHRWFVEIEWDNLLSKKSPSVYKPPIK